jgi:hypothetical protein
MEVNYLIVSVDFERGKPKVDDGDDFWRCRRNKKIEVGDTFKCFGELVELWVVDKSLIIINMKMIIINENK